MQLLIRRQGEVTASTTTTRLMPAHLICYFESICAYIADTSSVTVPGPELPPAQKVTPGTAVIDFGVSPGTAQHDAVSTAPPTADLVTDSSTSSEDEREEVAADRGALSARGHGTREGGGRSVTAMPAEDVSGSSSSSGAEEPDNSYVPCSPARLPSGWFAWVLCLAGNIMVHLPFDKCTYISVW